MKYFSIRFNFFQHILRGEFTYLFIALLMFFVLFPFLDEYHLGRFMLDIFLTLVLLASIYAVAGRRPVLVAAIVLAVPFLAGTWLSYALKMDSLRLMGSVFGVILFALTLVSIIGRILQTTRVTADTIYGGISVYLLFGLLVGLLFIILETLQPGSFRNVVEHDANNTNVRLFYYSFVTLTTLGYGDIVPLSPPTQMLSALEAASGQIYLAVLIARLVGLHINQRRP